MGKKQRIMGFEKGPVERPWAKNSARGSTKRRQGGLHRGSIKAVTGARKKGERHEVIEHCKGNLENQAKRVAVPWKTWLSGGPER